MTGASVDIGTLRCDELQCCIVKSWGCMQPGAAARRRTRGRRLVTPTVVIEEAPPSPEEVELDGSAVLPTELVRQGTDSHRESASVLRASEPRCAFRTGVTLTPGVHFSVHEDVKLHAWATIMPANERPESKGEG